MHASDAFIGFQRAQQFAGEDSAGGSGDCEGEMHGFRRVAPLL
jgi:hypothetical protein